MSDTPDPPVTLSAALERLTQTQQALAEATEAAAALRFELATVRHLMETVGENMTDGVTLIDADRRIVHINRAAQDFLGMGPIAPGTTVEAVLRNREAAGDVVVIDGHKLSIAERLERIFDPRGSRFERKLARRRHGEVVFRPLSGGRTLCICRDITDLKLRQADLREARDNLAYAHRLTSTILETMADGVALFDADRRLTYINAALQEYMVLPGRDHLRLGMTMQEIARARVAAGEEASEDGAVMSAEERVAQALQPGGNRFVRRLATGQYVEFLFKPVGDGRLLGLYRDVTDLKLRQKELKEARDESRRTRDLMRAVLDNMSDGAALIEGARIVYCNKALGALFSFAGSFEPNGMDVAEVIRRLEAAGDFIVERGSRLPLEERLRRSLEPSGATFQRRLPSGRHVEVRLVSLGSRQSLAVYRDITDLKQREIELRQARDRAAVEQRRTADMVNRVPDGICLFEGERIVYFNPALASLLGFTGVALAVGITLRDLVEAQERSGDRVMVDGRCLTADERIARVLKPGGSRFERQLESGRSLEFRFVPLGEGRTLGVCRDITDLKRRQVELERARDEVERARSLMDAVLSSMPLGVTLFDSNRRLVYANGKVRLGNTPMPRGVLPFELKAEDIIRRQMAAGDHLYDDKGAPLTLEQRLARTFDPKGSRSERQMPSGRYVEFSFAPISDGLTLGIYRDITELKLRQLELERARDEIVATQKLSDAILKGLPVGVTVFDAEHRVIYSNRKIGAPASATGPDGIPRLTTLDDIIRHQIAAGDHHYDEQGKALTLQQRIARVVSPQGSRSDRRLASGRHMEFTFRPLGDGATLSIVRDITDIKDRERELERARDELAGSHRLTNTILEGMSDGVGLLNADGTIGYMNSAVREIFGLPDEEATAGLTITDLVKMQRAQGDEVTVDGRTLSVEERVARLRDPRGARFERRLTSGRHIEFTFRALEGGRTLGLYRDITELKERQAEIERARDAAEAANQSKSTFLATMSHEIRTPMNGVMGTAELLEREPLADRQKRLVRTIRNSAATLLRIIDDVLDFSKIEAGRMELEVAPFQLRGLVEGISETLSVEADRKGLRIVTTVDARTPDFVEGDATRVRQILFNLIGNAIKFTDVGEVCVAVAGVPSLDGQVRLSLSIADSGIGMSEAQMARLFKPFSQGDSSTTRRYGGTGLGLSIVRRLAELMGGGVTVASAPGKGSTFTVVLELALARHGPDTKVSAPLTTKGRVGGRVLAVDDYPINLEVLMGQLEVLGVPIDTAIDGLEALNKWREQSYALVLTDIHMPDMDGFELTRQIRAEEALTRSSRRTPIVALTANALKGEAERCLAAGMDGYLTKPLTLDRLRDTVERWLGSQPDEAEGPLERAPIGNAVDRSVIAQMFGDNPDMIERVLRRFADSAGMLVAEIVTAADDSQRITDLAHKLKGAARAAGALRLGDLAAVLEEAADKPSIAALAVEWQRVAAALGRSAPD